MKIETVLSHHEIAAVLSRTIKKLEAGKIPPSAANAISNQVGKYLGTKRLVMDYSKLSGKRAYLPELDAPEKPIKK